MSIGSISSSLMAGAYDALRSSGENKPEAPAGAEATIADHVAAADGQEPIRSVSATLGTLVDTYL